MFTFILKNKTAFFQALGVHLWLCIATLLISMIIAVPLGILCARHLKIAGPVTNFFNMLKVVPSLALLIAIMPVLGVGFAPALVALLLCAIPTILINTYLGFKETDPSVIESARGMGMSKREIFTKVELPLSMPLIITGVRICSVDVIATATLSAYIGAGGLGTYVISGLNNFNNDEMFAGSLSIAAVAVIIDLALTAVQRSISKYKAD